MTAAGLLLALCLACGTSGGEGGSGSSDDVSDRLLDEVRGELDCATAQLYCEAVDFFAEGSPPRAVSRPTTWIGVSRSVGSDRGFVSYLLVRSDQMLIGEVTPDDDDERAQLQRAVQTLEQRGTLPETAPVVGFVRGLLNNPAYDPWRTRAVGRSWYARRGDEQTWLRQRGSALIAIQHRPASDSVLVFRQR